MYKDPFAALTALPTLLARMEERLAQLEQPDEVLKTKEAAQLLRIGEAELLVLVHAGRLPHWHIGNGFRYSRQQLLAHLREEAARASGVLQDVV